jgi:hypothetical protein
MNRHASLKAPGAHSAFYMLAGCNRDGFYRNEFLTQPMME